jgi:hypothetical protein
MVGFKADNLGGYTVLYDQLVVGIKNNAVYDKIVDETGAPSLVKKRVREDGIKFSDGKPVPTSFKRDVLHRDLIDPIRKQLETKTKQPYTVMSDKGTRIKGSDGQWFWLMPTRDVKRLSSVFPGGFFKISGWGMAF